MDGTILLRPAEESTCPDAAYLNFGQRFLFGDLRYGLCKTDRNILSQGVCVPRE